MAIPETRDFLGLLDQHYSANPHYSSSSPPPPPPLHFSLRATESDCSNNAERVFEEEATTTSHVAMNDTSTTYKRKKSAEETFLHGGNVYAYHNNSPVLPELMPPLLRDSMTPLRVPLARKVSLARFFQKRNERVQKLLLSGRNSSCDRSATFLQLKNERKSETIPAHTELELYGALAKRQCVNS